MHRLRHRLRRAALLALPVACASGSPPAGSSSSGGGSTGSGPPLNQDGGRIGYSVCAACEAQGLTCDYWGTSCVPACLSCPCETVIKPVGPTDGGYPDGGLSPLICHAACPDPLYATPPAVDLQWWITGCAVVDGGCPIPPDAGADGDLARDGGTQCVACEVVDCTGAGRLPEGGCIPRSASGSPLAGYLSRVAYLESEAIQAFERMASELRYFGAPRELIERAEEARQDEVRHAAKLAALAAQRGGRRFSVPARSYGRRSLAALAEENAIEGCVRETYGAAALLIQASQATDGAIAETWATIAEDEARHAELSWDLHRWVCRELSPHALARLKRRQRGSIARSAPTDRDEAASGWRRELGLLEGRQARSLWQTLQATLWT